MPRRRRTAPVIPLPSAAERIERINALMRAAMRPVCAERFVDAVALRRAMVGAARTVLTPTDLQRIGDLDAIADAAITTALARFTGKRKA